DTAMHARLRGADGMSALLRKRTSQACLAMSVERQRSDLEAIARFDRHALRPASRSTPCRRSHEPRHHLGRGGGGFGGGGVAWTFENHVGSKTCLATPSSICAQTSP